MANADLGIGSSSKRERKQGSDAMRTGKGVVTLPPEGRWGEMAAFGFPHRLRNRGLLCPPRLMRKRTSLCPSFDALGRGTKVLVFLGWVRYQMVDVRAVRVSTHLSLFRSPCRSICEPKQKGESDGSCRFHIQRLFFPAPSPSPLPASFCLSPRCVQSQRSRTGNGQD